MKTFIKKLYDLIPFKKHLFLFLKCFWSPKHAIYKHLHFKGVIDLKISDTNRFKIKHYGFQLENELFWSGINNGWEKESTKLWIKLCSKAQVVFDIGANTGIYALIAKAMNPSAKVFAFEPVERVFEKLQENILLNNFDIIPIKKALSNTTGEAIIYDTNKEHVYSVTVNKNLSTPDVEVVETKIETITLNAFIKENKISEIDLMKIDVETHEPEVLEGFSEYIAKFKPTLLIEILNDEVGEKVEHMVKGLDYLYFNIDENRGLRQVSAISKSDYYNYLLCSRAEAVFLKLI